MKPFIVELQAMLPPEVQVEYDELAMWMLDKSLTRCKMEKYPLPIGDLNGVRASGKCLCIVCGQEFFSHPYDWRVIGHGNVPFLNILCDGTRVKL